MTNSLLKINTSSLPLTNFSFPYRSVVVDPVQPVISVNTYELRPSVHSGPEPSLYLFNKSMPLAAFYPRYSSPPDCEIRLQILKGVHARWLAQRNMEDAKEIVRVVEDLLPDLATQGNSRHFFQALWLYLQSLPDLDKAESLFGIIIKKSDDLEMCHQVFKEAWNPKMHGGRHLIKIAAGLKFLRFSDKIFSLLLADLSPNLIGNEGSLAIISELSENPHLSAAQVELVYHLILTKKSDSGRWYALALGSLGRNPQCNLELAKKIAKEIQSCKGPLAAKDEGLFRLAQHPTIPSPLMGIYDIPQKEVGLRTPIGPGLMLLLEEEPTAPSLQKLDPRIEGVISQLRSRPSFAAIHNLHHAWEIFRSSFPCDKESGDTSLVMTFFQNWRHTLIAPTTADIFLERIADNILGYQDLFGEHAGQLFYRQSLLATPIQLPSEKIIYLVLARGMHEGYTGVQVGLYGCLPDNDRIMSGAWIGSYFARGQFTFEKYRGRRSLNGVNFQGYHEQRFDSFLEQVKSKMPSPYNKRTVEKYRWHVDLYRELQQTLSGANIHHIFLSLMIRLAYRNNFETIGMVRDGAQTAYLETSHRHGLYDAMAQSFGFSPAREGETFHRLDVASLKNQSTPEAEEPSRIINTLARAARKNTGRPTALAYTNLFLPAWRSLSFKPGPYGNENQFFQGEPLIRL